MKKNILYFIIGILLTITFGIGAAFLYKAKDIEFTPKDSSWNVNNMQDAIDDLKENYVPKSSYLELVNQVANVNFSYTGSYQTYKVYNDGLYKIELWGAAGGKGWYSSESNSAHGGYGAYTSGTIHLSKDDTLYIYVGGKGTDHTSGNNTVSGGWNGGGTGAYDTINSDTFGAGGGGATDVRLVPGTWNNFDSLKSRIMVAAGGGGGAITNLSNNEPGDAAYGGTLTVTGTVSNWYTTTWTPTVTQITGNAFGIGVNGVNGNEANGGGGGGYYGGTSCSNGNGGPGAGGTSYISGYEGCNAINESSTSPNIVHTGQSKHYSGKIFDNTIMYSGLEEMPTHDGNSTMKGNSENGYARITLISLD